MGGGCPLEPSFAELYPLLGQKEAQDAIRDKFSGLKHCPMLRADASACRGCSNNPYEQPAAAPDRWSAIIDRGYLWHDLTELGIPPVLGLVQRDILRVIHQDILIDRMKIQAMLIAAKVAELFAGK